MDDILTTAQKQLAHLDVEVLDIIAFIQFKCTRCGMVHNIDLATGPVACGCNRFLLWNAGLWTTEVDIPEV